MFLFLHFLAMLWTFGRRSISTSSLLRSDIVFLLCYFFRFLLLFFDLIVLAASRLLAEAALLARSILVRVVQNNVVTIITNGNEQRWRWDLDLTVDLELCIPHVDGLNNVVS
jgi:hypothetical protein